MPKDNRQILRGVQIYEEAAPGKKAAATMRTFVAGQEDELQAKLTPEQFERLRYQGALSGDWEPGKALEVDAEKAKRVEEAQKGLAKFEKAEAKAEDKAEAKSDAKPAAGAAPHGHTPAHGTHPHQTHGHGKEK